MNTPQPHFVCHDLGFCASLRALGIPMLDMRRGEGNRFIFSFTATNEIMELERSYWAGKLSIDALTYFNAIKVVKSLIHSQNF